MCIGERYRGELKTMRERGHADGEAVRAGTSWLTTCFVVQAVAASAGPSVSLSPRRGLLASVGTEGGKTSIRSRNPAKQMEGIGRERARTCCEVFVCRFPPFNRIKAATPFRTRRRPFRLGDLVRDRDLFFCRDVGARGGRRVKRLVIVDDDVGRIRSGFTLWYFCGSRQSVSLRSLDLLERRYSENVPACSPVTGTMSSTTAAPFASTVTVSAACADSAGRADSDSSTMASCDTSSCSLV